MGSLYDGKEVAEWSAVTEGLIARHPLKKEEIAETVLKAWDLILKDSVIGGLLKIGVDIFPIPSILVAGSRRSGGTESGKWATSQSQAVMS